MYSFNYVRAASVADAAKALSGNAKLMAGGQTLIPTLKQRLASAATVVDIGGVADLKAIKSDGKTITIGAAATHASVAGNADVRKLIPALAKLAGGIGDPQVRNRGTIGGSIANNDPAADYPAAVLGLDAHIMTTKRTIAAADFFTGMFETALEGDEVITAISFEAPAKSAYEKFRNPASRYAMAGVFVAKRADGSVRVAVTGAGSGGVFRHQGMEAALASNWSPSAIDGTSVDQGHMLSDLHGTAAYRAALVKAMAKRAVAKAG